MKSVKIKFCLIIALALLAAVSVGAFFGITLSRADRAVTVGSSNVFSVSGDARIWAHRVEHKTGSGDAETDDPYYYTMFVFENDDDAVNYRRNLAYEWFYDGNDIDDCLPDTPRKGKDGDWWIREHDTDIPYNPDVKPVVENGVWVIDGQDTGVSETRGFTAPEAKKGYLSLEIGFEEINFEKFTITFETQQYNMTKDEKTVNYIIFLPISAGEAGAVAQNELKCVITSDKDVAESAAKDIEVPADSQTLNPDHIKIELSNRNGGDFDVKVVNVNPADNEEYGTPQTGKFENVGGTFARNVTSNTNPVVPLSFKAELPESGEGDSSVTRVRMPLYSLNGQSFLLNRDADGYTNSFSPINEVDDGDGKKHYTGGQVNDTTPPVLCLSNSLRHINEGSELSSYTAIDVLTQYTTTETGYFILTGEQAQNTGFKAEDYSDTSLFKTVKTDYDQYIIPHANHYVPQEADYLGTNFGEDYVPVAAIKVYVKMTDTTSTGGQTSYVFLDWYLDAQYKLKINGNDYVAVTTDKSGAYYAKDGKDGEGNDVTSEAWKTLTEEYQKEVDEAASELRAGTDDFYLPSFEKLIKDNSTAYSDMTFSIYYMVNGTKSSATGKSASELSLTLNSAGDYLFTVYAQDAASNEMWYNKEVDGGEKEKVKFAASEIWDIYDDEDLRETLPWFSFKAGISEISIEEPEEQETAYVGKNFTADSFEVKGISTKSVNTLYRFNSELYAADHDGRVLSYENFMEIKGELFDGEGRKYFINIPAVADLEEGSAEYEQFASYGWDASTRTFVPQDGNAFYLVVCEATSTQFPDMPSVKAYMGIAASVTPDPIKGEDTWVKDNMISIILLTIAGAAFIGIILLLVIKPKEKVDIDEQFEREAAEKADAAAKKNRKDKNGK